ncbi:MAG: hypothetical protein JSV27_08210 [Candidatus Bathyarchaeota archaeon]|nr:MAG: hypothetical protein JSV27_08210 [Candidatus Bathyarchaeota archaeon]
MYNLGVRTLIQLLGDVGDREPVNFSDLCLGGRRGYGMVGRYLKFCMAAGLIDVVAVRKGRGRYPSRDYALSERGRRLLELFGEGFE